MLSDMGSPAECRADSVASWPGSGCCRVSYVSDVWATRPIIV